MTQKTSDWMFGCFLGLVAIALILGNVSAALDAMKPRCNQNMNESEGRNTRWDRGM